jgi:hypothetical protein
MPKLGERKPRGEPTVRLHVAIPERTANQIMVLLNDRNRYPTQTSVILDAVEQLYIQKTGAANHDR